MKREREAMKLVQTIDSGRALLTFVCAVMLFASAATPMMLVACGPTAVKNDRTEGTSLEMHWNNAAKDRISYYIVETSGEFRSSGGAMAADRATTFRTPLSDEDIAEFLRLVIALNAANRPEEVGEKGDRTEVVVRDARGKHEFLVFGADAQVEALRAWCASIALRQYRDTIDAQPEAGPRTR
ncbi:MAG: hypothetical protein RL591_180 [Planctomycetota bacterium]